MSDCDWCQWPARYYVYRGAGGSRMFKVCPNHVGLGVDRANHKGRALVVIIP